MKEINYFELEQFEGFYLEDSFVIQILETPEFVSFKMEFVLSENHPKYSLPKDGEAYCYQNGYINFITPVKVIWENRNEDIISIDINGESDLGNIDIFYKVGDDYLLEGDWGRLIISCEKLLVLC